MFFNIGILEKGCFLKGNLFFCALTVGRNVIFALKNYFYETSKLHFR